LGRDEERSLDCARDDNFIATRDDKLDCFSEGASSKTPRRRIRRGLKHQRVGCGEIGCGLSWVERARHAVPLLRKRRWA
jgi:hypothetical protein